MHIPSATRQIPTQPGMHTLHRSANVRAERQPRQEAPNAASNAAAHETARKDDGRLERMHDALAHRLARIQRAYRAQAATPPPAVEPSASSPNTDGPSASGPNHAHRHGMHVAHRHAPAAPGPNVPVAPVEPNVASAPIADVADVANVAAAPVQPGAVQGDDGEQHSGQIFGDLMQAVRSMLGAYSKQMPGEETGLALRDLGKQFGLALRDIYGRQQSGELDDAGVHQEINAAFHMLVEGLSGLSGGSEAPAEPVDPTPQPVELAGAVEATPAGAVPPQYGQSAGLKGVFFSGTVQAKPDTGAVEAPVSNDVPSVPPAGNDDAAPVESDRLRSILRALRQLRADLAPGGPGRRMGVMPNAAPGQNAVPTPRPAAPEAPGAGGLPVENRFAAARSAFADLRGAREHEHPGHHFDRLG